MPFKLEPAELAFDAGGQRAADSHQLQARQVFLAGNQLPPRWAGAPQFTIVECGFGFGLNFLATWQAWRGDPNRCARLHYVAVEKHPFTRESLALLHARYPALAELSSALQTIWPQLVPGLQRLQFDGGQVTLTLAFADIAVLNDLRLGADAFYLDGFAPEHNPEMWRARVMQSLARLARPGATFATYTTGKSVRDALAGAGFAVEKRPGFCGKRYMLVGRYAPRWTPRHAPPATPMWTGHRAIVIGAGIAGAAAAERLAARGWQIELIERNEKAAAEASGLHAGAFHPQLSADDNLLARLTRAGFLYALQRWTALEAAGHSLQWQRCGVLRLAQDAADGAQRAASMRQLAYPPQYAAQVTAADASLLANCKLGFGGWWFPEGGWMRAASLVHAQLAAIPQLTAHFGVEVHALKREAELWHALDSDGGTIAAAPVVILANAHDAARLTDFAQPLASLRGQLTYLPESTMPGLRAVLTGDGYLLPAIDGIAIAGATVDFADDDTAPRTSAHLRNLRALERMLPGSTAQLDAAMLDGAVGFRCAAPDRLPLIGAVPDLVSAHQQTGALTGAHAPDLPRLPGLYAACAYGSRGLLWAALAGEVIASLINGEPPPLQASLLDAIDPGRFALKRLRRSQL